MRALVIFFGMMLFGANTFAQYGYDNNTYDGPDRYFYDDNFDWRWDIRVRISDGIDNGSLTRREADRLYDRLERIERKEYAYQSDGYLSAMEQDEIWEDVVYLNRLIGLELSDWDRTYYGYSMPGVSFRGYLPWYAGGNYDFYRFDRRGFGSLSFGYHSRNYYPKNHVYYGNRNYGYNWDRTKNYGSHSGWGNSSRNNGWGNGGNRTYGSRDNNSSWGNGTRNNSGTWGNQDRNRNNSGGSNGGWNNSDRNKSGNNTPSNENTNKTGSWGNSGRNRSSDNSGSGTGSWGNTGRNGSTDNTGGNRSGGSWGNNSGNSTPSTAPSRSQRNEAPSQTSRSYDTGRSNRDEIMTPRPSTNNSETRTSRGDGGRANVPDRGRANDSRRGVGREF